MSSSKTWNFETDFKATCKSIMPRLDEKFELDSGNPEGIHVAMKELPPPQEHDSERRTVEATMAYHGRTDTGDDTQPKVVSFDQKKKDKTLKVIEDWTLEKQIKGSIGQGVKFTVSVFAEPIVLSFTYIGSDKEFAVEKQQGDDCLTEKRGEDLTE